MRNSQSPILDKPLSRLSLMIEVPSIAALTAITYIASIVDYPLILLDVQALSDASCLPDRINYR
jgi:hypothetical protein